MLKEMTRRKEIDVLKKSVSQDSEYVDYIYLDYKLYMVKICHQIFWL